MFLPLRSYEQQPSRRSTKKRISASVPQLADPLLFEKVLYEAGETPLSLCSLLLNTVPHSTLDRWKGRHDQRCPYSWVIDACVLNAPTCFSLFVQLKVQAAVFARATSGSPTSSSKSVR